MLNWFAAPLAGLAAQIAVLAVMAATTGLDAFGWVAGAGYGVIVAALLARSLVRHPRPFGPADWVTSVRAVLVGVVTALVVESFDGTISSPLLVTLAAAALVLDAVDGAVARATDSATAGGARFDMEVDAFLILLLSVYAAPSIGAWVLLIGLARYLFVAACVFLPWLRQSAPARYWSKVVAAIQGITLTVVASGLLPRPVAAVVLLVALGLLIESFAHQVRWLWRHRTYAPRRRVVSSIVVSTAAFVVIWFVLVVPPQWTRISPAALAAVPLAGLIIAALAVVMPSGGRRIVTVAGGILVGLTIVLKAFDIGFYAIFDRPFDVLSDWYYLGPGIGVLADSVGPIGAACIVVGAIVFAIGAIVVAPLAVGRIVKVCARHRARAASVVVAVALVWAVAAAMSLQIGGTAVASTSTATSVYERVDNDLRDAHVFADRISDSPLARYRPGRLLAGLAGKDVLLTFVESYGKSAVTGSSFSPGVDAVLDDGTKRLHASGFSARSAYLTSPTFGGSSWLAHSTLESGLWVDTQQRYDQLLTSDRATLAGVFSRAGWRTVSDVPADTKDWPQGKRFYGFDELYDARNVGYRGPEFSYATMPDQYVLKAFQRLELSRDHRSNIMAEIDLISSHAPWTPLPKMVDWNDVGDGSVFNGMPEDGPSPESVFGDPARTRALYGKSIEYTLRSIFSFVTQYGDDDLVMIVVGDHQPHSEVTGPDPSHDAPVSIIAHDSSVFDRIAGWRWRPGMRPGRNAPVWPMSDFRNRFFNAFGDGVDLPDRAPISSTSRSPRR